MCTPDLEPALERILDARSVVPSGRSLLVGVSGIDASGKGFCSRLIVEALQGRGSHAVGIGLDPWYHLPSVRFGGDRPGEHFYHHGFRFEDLFDQLVEPLKRTRSVAVDALLVDDGATDYRPYRYEFADVDIVVLEGIFLFQPRFRSHFDVALWVECSFETALERAVRRGQEGLPPAETIEAFETIYFPAERYHLERDDPRASADVVVVNDPRLESAR